MFVSTQYLRKWSSRRRIPPGSLEVIPDVYSPELNNRRDISVYLPRSYRRTEHPYPVIYMHDGQNLFDPETSFACEWGVGQAIGMDDGFRLALRESCPKVGFRRGNKILE